MILPFDEDRQALAVATARAFLDHADPNWRKPAPVTLAEAMTCPEVRAMVEALSGLLDRCDTLGERGQIGAWVEIAAARAALAPLETLK